MVEPPMNRRPELLCRMVLLLAALLSPGIPGQAQGAAADRWSVIAMLGQQDASRFLDIVVLDGGNLRSSYVGGLVLAREFAEWRRGLLWEAEAQLYRHWGRQNLWEGNLALAARWTRFPWNHVVDTRASFGQGLSLASERPPIEGTTREFLHYMHVDLEFSPPGNDRFAVIGRVHHRSGAFGLYGVSGGSNFLNLGLRYRF